MIYSSTHASSGIVATASPPFDDTADLSHAVADNLFDSPSTAGNAAPAAAADGLTGFVGFDGASALSLTPDALMAYCQARLDSVDGQVKGIMGEQELRNNENKALQGVIQTFQNYSTGVNGDASTCKQLEYQLYGLITNLNHSDPGCSELGKLEQIYNNVLWSGSGPTEVNGVKLDYINEEDHPPDQSTNEGDNVLGSSEMQTYVDQLQGCASDLNSDSELQMIQLQSLMSQRHTAVELTTNLLQSLDGQTEKIAENVGH